MKGETIRSSSGLRVSITKGFAVNGVPFSWVWYQKRDRSAAVSFRGLWWGAARTLCTVTVFSHRHLRSFKLETGKGWDRKNCPVPPQISQVDPHAVTRHARTEFDVLLLFRLATHLHSTCWVPSSKSDTLSDKMSPGNTSREELDQADTLTSSARLAERLRSFGPCLISDNTRRV